MKNILLLLTLTLCQGFIFGQTSSKPEDCPKINTGQSSNKSELSFSLNTVDPFLPLGNIHFLDKYLDGGDYTNISFAVGLMGKYFFNESEGLRIKFIYTDRNIRDYRDLTTGSHFIDDEKFCQTLLKFAPGFLWTVTKNKISFIGGVELPITIIGKMSYNEYSLRESLDGSG